MYPGQTAFTRIPQGPSSFPGRSAAPEENAFKVIGDDRIPDLFLHIRDFADAIVASAPYRLNITGNQALAVKHLPVVKTPFIS